MNPKDPFNFNKHVEEMSRVLKTNGTLILSIPKKTSFIFKNSKIIKKGYRLIRDDYFKVREGQVMRCFSDKLEIEKNFKANFKSFNHSSIDIDWFGLNYHWHILIAKKEMSTKTKILDCTLRDGSYLNNFQFTKKQTFDICSKLQKSRSSNHRSWSWNGIRASRISKI